MSEADESASAVWSPRIDLVETDDQYRMRVDLPGLSKNDVSITVEDNRLTIRGERTDESRTESENVVHMERTFGTFYRSLRLPKAVNEDKIKARFTNGVLSVDIPKTETSKPKTIKIS
jgi:HSP20 family protein